MGYDVPMERELKTKDHLEFYGGSSIMLEEEIQKKYGENSAQLLDNYNKLNNLGKETANQRVEELTRINEYTEKKQDNQANG